MNIKLNKSKDSVKVLLVGNNPIELGSILEKLNGVRGQKIITETAFDIQSILERLGNFNANFILIDDNIGREKLLRTTGMLSKNKKTKNIPITILKNSNYHESTTSSNILDYLLKQNLSGESLYNTIKNTLRFRRTQKLLIEVYERRRGLFGRFSMGRSALNLLS